MVERDVVACEDGEAHQNDGLVVLHDLWANDLLAALCSCNERVLLWRELNLRHGRGATVVSVPLESYVRKLRLPCVRSVNGSAGAAEQLVNLWGERTGILYVGRFRALHSKQRNMQLHGKRTRDIRVHCDGHTSILEPASVSCVPTELFIALTNAACAAFGRRMRLVDKSKIVAVPKPAPTVLEPAEMASGWATE